MLAKPEQIPAEGNSKPNPLRVLIVEDSEPDALLIVRELRRGGLQPAFERVDTSVSMRAALEAHPWDLIISDYAMPQFGRSISILIPSYRPGDLPELYEMILRGERVDRFETIRIRKDRTPVEVSITFSSIRDAAGRVVGVSTVGRDITDSKREEKERLS